MSNFDTFYLLALRYLHIRFRSEKEIRDYLKKKINPRHPRPDRGSNQMDSRLRENDESKDEIAQTIDLVIHKLKQQKFLNDEEFAKMWIRSRTEFKPKGERLIRLELQQKGVAKDIVDKAFEAFDSAPLGNPQGEQTEKKRDELTLAKEILEKKRKKFEVMERQERFNKAGSLLARRGFNLDEIKKAIEDVFGK